MSAYTREALAMQVMGLFQLIDVDLRLLHREVFGIPGTSAADPDKLTEKVNDAWARAFIDKAAALAKLELAEQFEVSVKLLVEHRDRGELLLLRRHSDRGDLFWDLPGGRLLTGESIDDAIRRELLEEVGWPDDVVVKLFHAGTWRSKLLLYYRTQIAVESVVLSAEHDSYVWLRPDQLNTLTGARLEPELRMLIRVLAGDAPEMLPKGVA
jgi:8-oxo-dGTP diphosphatase